MYKLSTILTSLALLSTSFAYGCTDIIINKNEYISSARTLDFDKQIDSVFSFYMPNVNNTSDIIVDVDKIPEEKVHSWTNKYGFVGLNPYKTSSIIYDGMNSEGLAVGMLYHSTSASYANYNPKDERPAINVLELGNFILGTAKSLDEALESLAKLQIVKGAIKVPMGEGLFVQHPVHFIIHDKGGTTAVIEFLEGKVVITSNTVNVMANTPEYSWHLENLKKYDKFQPNFQTKSSEGGYTNGSELDGLPGDYSSPSRFAKAAVLVRLTPAPVSLMDSVSRSKAILDAVSVPRGASEATTLVKIVRDHIDQKYYFHREADFYNYLNNEELYSHDVTRGMNVIDLKSINWNHKFKSSLVIKPTKKSDIKKVIIQG
jgi:choloylglycine hydrolase